MYTAVWGWTFEAFRISLEKEEIWKEPHAEWTTLKVPKFQPIIAAVSLILLHEW